MEMYEMFRTDKKAESEVGVILDYGNFKIRIARAGGENKKFERIVTARMKPFRRQLEADLMDNEVAKGILIEAYADAVILGWETRNKEGNFVIGIQDEKGIIQPYSRDNIIKAFMDLPDLFADVQEQSRKVSLFRSVELGEDLKNFKPV
jgi:hypothetical protein